MLSAKFLFAFALLFLLSYVHADENESIILEEKDVPEEEKLAPQLLDNSVPGAVRSADDKKTGLCKKYKCDKKIKCEEHKCDCYVHKYDCHCKKHPYKCCEPYKYKCKCFDEKYACNCEEKKYKCKCVKKPYECNCTYDKYKCRCKYHKYQCGFEPGHTHGGKDDDNSHTHRTSSILGSIQNLFTSRGGDHDKYYHQHPKYCYKKECDTCYKKKCDTCYKEHCSTCKKKTCDECTEKKCLGICHAEKCKTCYKEYCETCTEIKCKTCKKCKKVYADCKFFLVKCNHKHEDEHDKKH